MTPRPPTRLRQAAAWLALGPLVAVLAALFLVYVVCWMLIDVAAVTVVYTEGATGGRTWSR